MKSNKPRLAFLGALVSVQCWAAEPWVVLDTGHSPAKPGAISASGHPEHAFNLQATHYLAQELGARGVRVTRTGHDGAEWSLKSRASAAQNADLFLSVHHDSIQQAWLDQGRAGEFAGFSTFVSHKNTADLSASMRCASAIGTAMRQIGERPSLYHATPIKGENRPLLDPLNGVHRFDDLVVLKTATSPAVLLEVGVIVNPQEERKLADPVFVARYAATVAEAIVGCLQKAR